MKTFTHYSPRTIGEALELLEKHGGKAKLNAGGTDLLGMLKGRVLSAYPEAIIDLKAIEGLDYIRQDKDGLSIGAVTKLARIASSALVTQDYKALSDAALSVATPQVRNMCTIGGNLAQDVRCWYYRYPYHLGGPITCPRKGSGPCLAVRGDNRYHAIMNGKRCFAVCPSDTAVALSALEAVIGAEGPAGARNIPVDDFFLPLRIALRPHEMVTDIRIPATPAGARQGFLKFTLRKPVDFAIVSVASVITLEDGVCTGARIALGAVAPAPVRARAAEEVISGRPIDEAVAAEAAELALAEAKPLSMNGYKVEIAKLLIKRAVLGHE
jgi:xanthine dehydrogenase YagS FAD-binding subunit